MGSASLPSRLQVSQGLAPLSAATFFSGNAPERKIAAVSIFQQTTLSGAQQVSTAPLIQRSLAVRTCAEMLCVAALCAIMGTLIGCSSSVASGRDIAPVHSLATPQPTGSLIADSPVPAGAISILEWSTEGATEVEVEGEEVYSTLPIGSQTLSPSHRSLYFLAASNPAGILEKSLVLDVIVPEAQQISAHGQWVDELPAALSTLQCGDNIAYQQPGQSLQDALAMAAQNPSVSCLVLQPASTTYEVVYYDGLAADSGTTQIRYISDLPDVAFPDPVTPPDGEI